MRSKIVFYLLACLTVTSLVSSSCAASRNQTVTVQPSLTLETTATPVPAAFTLTPTRVLSPTVSSTPVPTATPTLYPIVFPPDCGQVKLGDAGTQVIDHTEKILVQGTAVMCGDTYVDSPFQINLPVLESMIDLDAGTFNVEDADLQFCPGGGSTLYYYFCDINDTAVRKYQAYRKPQQPPFEECLGTKPYSGVDDDEAKYLCVITTLGNISRVKVEQYDPVDGTLSFEISFVTWER